LIKGIESFSEDKLRHEIKQYLVLYSDLLNNIQHLEKS